MKTRYTILVFALMILAGLCFTTCNNPIMEKWWENGSGGRSVNVGIFNWGKYKVTFDMTGGEYVDLRTPPLINLGEPIPPQFIEDGKWVMDPGLAKKGALAFGGWYTAPSGGTRWSFGSEGTPVNSDMTLYVHWGSDGHSVKFREITNGGNDLIDTSKAVYRPLDEFIVPGELATEPLGFGSKDSNWGFKGWYTDTAFNDPWNFQTDTVTGDITLYAQWSATNPVTVTWNVNGSPDPAPAPTTVASGSKIAAPMSITNPGYAFGGWYTEATCYNEWHFDEDPVTADITLYAKWTTPGMSGTGKNPNGKEFTLGGDDPDTSQSYPNTSSPKPKVTIDRDFYIDQYEVTAAKYKAVTGLSPSRLPAGVSPDEYPVNRVTWFDAIEYCNNLSEKEGLEKVYTWTSGPERVTVGGITFIKSGTVSADLSKNGYRLPTEAEWEYAARGGEDIVGTPQDTTYAGSNNPDDVAWYDRNAGTVPHPVGLKLPNYLGLYDMSGNVSEWCWDAYHSTIYGSYDGVTDPINNDNSSKIPLERVRRGGNFNMIDVRIRSRTNNNKNPTFSWPPAPANNDLDSFITLGFRVVRTILP